MKKLLMILSFSALAILLGSSSVVAQNNVKEMKEKAKEIAKKDRKLKQEEENVASIEMLNFSFYPTTIEPEFGVQKDIDCLDCYFTVNKNYLYVNLPYMGRFYIQPLTPEDVPVKLYSNKFLYMVHTTNGVDFQVEIVPNDTVNILNEGITFTFNMNKDTGSATLVVSATNRQSVTYTGYFQ